MMIDQAKLKKLSLDDLTNLAKSIRAETEERIAAEVISTADRLDMLRSIKLHGHLNGTAHLLRLPAPAITVKPRRDRHFPKLSRSEARRTPPRFVNPANKRQHWSGEGDLPRWFADLLCAGHTPGSLNAGGTMHPNAKNFRARALYEASVRDGTAKRPHLSESLRRSFAARAPAKYVNPADPSEKWSGHGRPPKWARDMLRQGKKLVQLALPAPANPKQDRQRAQPTSHRKAPKKA